MEMYTEARTAEFKGFLFGLISRYSKHFKEIPSALGTRKYSLEEKDYAIVATTDPWHILSIVVTSKSEEQNKKIMNDLELKLRLNLTFTRAIKPKSIGDETSESIDRILDQNI